MGQHNFKRLEYDPDKDCYLVKRENLEKLFEMACNDFENDKHCEDNWCHGYSEERVAIYEHYLTAHEIVDALGAYRDYLDYSYIHRNIKP